ncbi:hypothetical protein [Turicimonas muris]
MRAGVSITKRTEKKFVKENAGITKHTKKNIKNVNADIANGEKTKEF